MSLTLESYRPLDSRGHHQLKVGCLSAHDSVYATRVQVRALALERASPPAFHPAAPRTVTLLGASHVTSSRFCLLIPKNGVITVWRNGNNQQRLDW